MKPYHKRAWRYPSLHTKPMTTEEKTKRRNAKKKQRALRKAAQENARVNRHQYREMQRIHRKAENRIRKRNTLLYGQAYYKV